jgi:hypothetical protein
MPPGSCPRQGQVAGSPCESSSPLPGSFLRLRSQARPAATDAAIPPSAPAIAVIEGENPAMASWTLCQKPTSISIVLGNCSTLKMRSCLSKVPACSTRTNSWAFPGF